MNDEEEPSDPAKPLPISSIDEDANDLMDAPFSSTQPPTSLRYMMTKTITPNEETMPTSANALPGEDPPPPPPHRRHAKLVAAVVTVGVLLASVITWWALRR